MKRMPIVGRVMMVLVFCLPAHAADLVLGQAEMRNLGIEFGRARTVNAAVNVEARAYVTVPPSSEFVISSALPGLVSRVLVDNGESVQQGQPLAEIRSSDYLALQQEFLESVHLASLAQAQLKRDEQLAEEGIIAERRLEETRANTAAATGRRAEHRQMLLIAGMQQRELRALEQTSALQDTLVIRAPIDGVILARRAKAGESIDSLVSLYRLADLSQLWLDIHLPQESATSVSVGTDVLVRSGTLDWPARIISIGQAVDPNTQAVVVRARLIDAAHGLKPGQQVTAAILASDRNGAEAALWSIPNAALFRSGAEAFVFVRSAAGVEARQVQPVGSSAGEVQVRGLGPTTDVVVTGVSALKALWLGEADSGS